MCDVDVTRPTKVDPGKPGEGGGRGRGGGEGLASTLEKRVPVGEAAAVGVAEP